ncbi:MAG TPA: amidohydrolase family protein [Dehalococcoidia bacterium]|nr:amidohydrolase family protein [Dehalococcoidia bacterium]
MTLDLVIKNGMVVDGTGFPRYQADIGIKDGLIVEKGRITDGAAQVIDADGLVVAPGIVDLHTHYDPQLHWERLGTSSVWHGVTTVMMGNCGLTFAPVKPQDRDYTLGIFSRVEELAIDTLRAGLPFDWETFGEYLDSLDKGLGLNVMPLVGHMAIRRYAMGEAADERAATPDEIVRMQQVLRESLAAGGWGWSTSISPTHVGPTGEPVPSRRADDSELLALAETLAEFNAGSIGIIPRNVIFGLEDSDKQLIEQLAGISRRPVIWNGHSYRWNKPESAFDEQAWMDDAGRRGLNIWALIRALPLDRWVCLQRTTFVMGLAVWRDLMELPIPERIAAFADPNRRQALRDAIDAPEVTTSTRGQLRPRIRWEALSVSQVHKPENEKYVGRSVTEIARTENKHIADVFLDIAISENLETVFRYAQVLPDDIEAKSKLLKGAHILPYTSDAAAHVNSDCLAGETSYLLGHWVREKGVFSLEEAIRRVTLMPATIGGLTDRGMIREGLAADIMVFDPETIQPKAKELVRDMPAGDTRYIQKAEGVSKVIVNGRVVIDEGEPTGELSGRVLRANQRA